MTILNFLNLGRHQTLYFPKGKNHRLVMLRNISNLIITKEK